MMYELDKKEFLDKCNNKVAMIAEKFKLKEDSINAEIRSLKNHCELQENTINMLSKAKSDLENKVR